jgi:lipopolysaccharide transport system ATP-binding protein
MNTSIKPIDISVPLLELDQVTKIYRSYSTPQQKLKEMLSGGRKRYFRETRALDDVSFALQRGERLGIVGQNGSGKSTLLKVLAGVLTPTSGTVAVRGRVSALLELGAGFTPDLTGRENINQFCLLHGMHDDEIEEAVPHIIAFSELGDAVSHPVRTYSSGMAVRLGFACAVYVQPDILIVDEALSVGDAYFQNKCLSKIRSMLDDGTTFIYVTHAADAIRSLCNRGLWLEHGKVRQAGNASIVGAAYQSETFSRMVRAGIADRAGSAVSVDDSKGEPMDGAAGDAATPVSSQRPDSDRLAAFAARVEPLRTGSGEILIDDISLIDQSQMETDVVEFGSMIRVRVYFHVETPTPDRCVLSLGINDPYGRQLLHFNAGIRGLFASDAAPHVQQMYEFVIDNTLCPGEFGLVAGVAKLGQHPQNIGQTMIERVIDYCSGGARFSVPYPLETPDHDLWGVVHVDYSVTGQSLD